MKILETKNISAEDLDNALITLKTFNELADAGELNFKVRAGTRTSIKNILKQTLSLLNYDKF